MVLIGKSKVEYMDYYLNYVRGCSHGCLYCWSRLRQNIPYEEWIKPKLRSIDGLDEQLEKFKSKIHRLFVCNSADAYQPAARATTREVVKKLIQHKIRFTILTKSDAALNDLDLLEAYPKCCVGFSVTTDDEGQRRKWEPCSSSIQERINAIRRLKEVGVRTWVSMEPILPESSPEKVEIDFKNGSHFLQVHFFKHVRMKVPNYSRKLPFNDHLRGPAGMEKGNI